MLDFCVNAVSHIPGLLLVIVGLGVLGWVVYLSHTFMSDKMGVDSSIYLPYCYYAISITGWIFANAFFQSNLLLIYDKNIALTVAVIANLFCFVALLFAYLFFCKLVFYASR
ncbi:hypothetical protein AT251_22975 [Enterovibrio nigricans]|nr:hypothetical protein AT251_22975 [Enterovibrio nigricans]